MDAGEAVTKAKAPPNIGVGSPAILLLEAFGDWVFRAFGETAYLVGSATRGKDWRDVDVRLILADETYDALFGDAPRNPQYHALWTLLCAALSALAKQQTGLPVDFQIQRQTWANKQYPDGWRQPLFTLVRP